MKRNVLGCLLVVLAAAGCSDGEPVAEAPAPDAGVEAPVGASAGRRLRGYRVVADDLRQRLFVAEESGEPAELYTLLATTPGAAGGLGRLTELLGAHVLQSGQFQFRNGTPTPVNMFLWDALMRRLSEELARVCGSETLALGRLNAEAHTALVAACRWPDAAAAPALALFAALVYGNRAPPAELATWLEFFTGPESPYRGQPGAVLVRDALRALFLNPYFLLD